MAGGNLKYFYFLKSTNMKYFSALVLLVCCAFAAEAKIWRVNNNAGVNADFTTMYAAVAAATAGDSIYLEPSATSYATNSFTLSKRLVFVGPGYFLDPTNASEPANTGLQYATKSALLDFFWLGAGADGSKFLGVTISGSIYVQAVNNVIFERVYFPAGLYFQSGNSDGFTFRKCFLNGGSVINSAGGTQQTNMVIENCIFYNGSYATLPTLSGSGNIFRNNTIVGGNVFTLPNCYIANSIFGIGSQCVFTNSTIKNNLFQIAQTLPGTAVNNQLSVNMANVLVGGSTGSLDSRSMLKSGSPAIAAGLTVGSVVTPDCGAFGATDPYRLSGIPNIPTIYSFTVPVSIPAGTSSMNITFSTRNNN